jgi:hypothetical protein
MRSIKRECLGYIEHTLQALRPSHRLVPLLRSLIITLMRLGSFATFGGRYIDTVFAVGRKHAMTKSSGMILYSFSWPTKWVSIREDTNKPIIFFPGRDGL